MDDAGEVEVVTDSVDHHLVGKTITFTEFAGGESITGRVTGAERSVDGRVYLMVDAGERGSFRIVQDQVASVDFDEMPSSGEGV